MEKVRYAHVNNCNLKIQDLGKRKHAFKMCQKGANVIIWQLN